LQLDNKDLRKKIEDLRKEKLAVAGLLETIKTQRDSLKMKFEELFINNEEALKSNNFPFNNLKTKINKE